MRKSIILGVQRPVETGKRTAGQSLGVVCSVWAGMRTEELLNILEGSREPLAG